MPAVVVDTDVVSFTFKKDTRARLYRRHVAGRTLLISFMTLAELHAWALQHRWGRARRNQLTQHLGRYAVHYADQRLCERWAEVRDGARLKGRPIGVADAWIAATALVHNLPLVTHNPADYAGVDGLTVLSAATP
jgi:tRNA(fMet)-specific endonuclease VapC